MCVSISYSRGLITVQVSELEYISTTSLVI